MTKSSLVPLALTLTCLSLSFAHTFEPNLWNVISQFPLKTIFNTSDVKLQPECRQAIAKFAIQIENYDLDALKMLDATAKLPSGILSGNVNQYGDFDECMQIPNAQYCLVELDLKNFHQHESYGKYHNLLHSYYMFRENVDDPAHRLPGFSFIKWGFCIPEQCSSEDLTHSIEANFNLNTRILPGMCQKATNPPRKWTFGDYFTRAFFAFIFSAVFLSTFLDYCHLKMDNAFEMKHLQNSIYGRLLMSFSILHNYPKIFTISNPTANEIDGVHGIRSLNALALLMSHKSVALFFNPYINRTDIVKKLTSPWTIIAKNAIVYTDSFLLLSGLLNANALFNDLKKSNSMNFKRKFISRLFRILPNLMALILFCTYILPNLGSGPMWPTTVTHHSTLCKSYMWRNFLFVHNYFGFENMCLTHTHQLGIDMQLFLMTPPIVYLIWNYNRLGIKVLFSLAFLSTILRIWVTYANELNSVVYFGISWAIMNKVFSVKKMFDTARLSYILPTHRATVYLMGVYLAYYLKQTKAYYHTNRLQQVIFWMAFLVSFFLAWLGPFHMTGPDFKYNKFEAALIAGFCPILFTFGVALATFILNRHSNVAGWLGHFFNWKYWQISSRLSYAIYLVQFPVFFFNVGVTKHVDEYKSYYQLQILETAAIVLVSTILVLCIELPFQNIHNILFATPKGIKQKNRNEYSDKEIKETNIKAIKRSQFG